MATVNSVQKQVELLGVAKLSLRFQLPFPLRSVSLCPLVGETEKAETNSRGSC